MGVVSVCVILMYPTVSGEQTHNLTKTQIAAGQERIAECATSVGT